MTNLPTPDPALFKPALKRLLEQYGNFTRDLIISMQNSVQEEKKESRFIIRSSKKIIQMFEQIISLAQEIERMETEKKC